MPTRKEKIPYIPTKEELYEERIVEETGETARDRMPEKYIPKAERVLREPAFLKSGEKVVEKIVKMQDSEIEPLKEMSKEIVGDIFEKVKFLKERISETKSAVEERKVLHEKFVEEINKDIEDRQEILNKLSDREQIREFKIDISLLRMEKRKETSVFWRDLLQLRRELTELNEECEVNSKIARLIGG